MCEARSHHSMVNYKGSLYVGSGRWNPHVRFRKNASFEKFDASSNEWQQRSCGSKWGTDVDCELIAQCVGSMSQDVTHGSNLLVVGDFLIHVRAGGLERYDDTNDCWIDVEGSTPAEILHTHRTHPLFFRWDCLSVGTQDGRVIVFHSQEMLHSQDTEPECITEITLSRDGNSCTGMHYESPTLRQHYCCGSTTPLITPAIRNFRQR
jgi:hypothetical protein